ncbi:restriction endonuclease subunit S [Thiobaca trueperi]|uniref:Type I restriction enzyme S subunit n=1 Tax=Thiobaca trueperi TaxID=127458 RepID=A0A4R3N6S7_9GAMM|nr:restriction endonuclease subunit S [Thiobaca trueperi]TCT23836.1 type I restriction enzyme S subunit [Thiobaca trueperi]
MSDIDDDGWLESSFGALCLRIVNGGTPDTGNAAYWNGETPWITGADFTVNGVGEFRRFVSDIGILGSATSVVKAGNLIVVTRTGVGKIAIAPCDIAISQDITGVYIDTEKVETFFVYYLLSRELEQIKKLNQGTSINGIIRSDLEKHVVRFPAAKSAQIKIASILSSIDTAIEKTEALIAKYQQIKAGLMHDLFTRGVLPNGQLRPPREQAPELYQETAIGWIPRDWRVIRLEEIADVLRGKFTHRPRNDPAYYGGLHPFIQTGDVSASNGGIIKNYSQTLSEIGATVSQSFPAGTIAITIAANIADTGILGIPMFFPDSIVGAILNDAANCRFIELCIRRSKHKLDAMAPQSAQKNINLKDLRPLQIPYPFRVEQDLIAKRIDLVQAKIDIEKKARDKLNLKKLGLMQDLLTGKVPVKVDEADATDG